MRLSLISAIENKKLATQIIQTYNTIKTAYGSFGAFMDIKLKCIEKLTDKAEVREALAKNKLRTKMQEWDFYFTIPEGVQAVQQISYIHSYPRTLNPSVFLRFLFLWDKFAYHKYCLP